MAFLKFLLKMFLRIMGIKTGEKSGPQTRREKAKAKKEEILERNRKLAIILASQSHLTAMYQQREPQQQGKAEDQSKGRGGGKSSDAQKAVIGKDDKPPEGKQRRTRGRRTMRRMRYRSKGHGRRLG